MTDPLCDLLDVAVKVLRLQADGSVAIGHPYRRKTPRIEPCVGSNDPIDGEQIGGPHFEEERIVRRTTIDPAASTGPTGFVSRQILVEPFYTLD